MRVIDVMYVFWFALGVNAAYAMALLTVVVVLKRGGDPAAVREDLMTVAPLGTAATLAWFVGATVIGPWWALLTTPGILAAVLLSVGLCAHVRAQRAKARA